MGARSNCVLIQQASGAHRSLLSLTQNLHSEYCERHGIDYWAFFGSPNDIGDRAPNWSRVLLMEQANVAGYEYIIWLDADCLIVGDVDLREGCEKIGFNMTRHDMSIFRDAGHADLYDHWNTGAIYYRTSLGSASDLNYWWGTPDEGHGWADQHSFNLAVKDGVIDTPNRIDLRWNSTLPYFTSPEPVVMAWHGFGDVETRKRAIKVECERISNTPKVFGESAGAMNARSDKFAAAMDLSGSGSDAEAEVSLREILADKPDEPEVLRALGQIVGLRGDVEEAERLFRLSVAYEPNVGGSWCALGAMAAGRGDYKEAGRCYDLALHFSPDMPMAHRNRALLRLMLGNYRDGFKEDWEWGRVAKQRRMRFPASTEWRGQDVDRLLVWSDQGAGDVLMNRRFLPKLRERLPHAHITWEVHDSLVCLSVDDPSVDTVVKLQLDGGMPVPYDAHVELGDLPHFLGLTSTRHFRIKEPYVHPDESLVSRWSQRISTSGLKVGIVWAGNPNHPNDANRSMKLSDIDMLLSVPGVTFYSLQVGKRAEGRAGLNELPIKSWADTAAIIECMDIVVAVDTGTAHLAGAMGQRVITFLPYAGDWRWGPHGAGDETHWYPSMTLLRQSKPGDWQEPVQRAAAVLGALANAQ